MTFGNISTAPDNGFGGRATATLTRTDLTSPTVYPLSTTLQAHAEEPPFGSRIRMDMSGSLVGKASIPRKAHRLGTWTICGLIYRSHRKSYGKLPGIKHLIWELSICLTPKFSRG